MRDTMPSLTTHHLRPGLWPLVLGLGVLLVLALLPWSIGDRAYAGPPFSPGDLVVGLGSSLDGSSRGELRHFSPNGTLLNTLLTLSGSFEETGACFDSHRRLYTTNFEANSVSKFHSGATVANSGFKTNLNTGPNSCTVDAAGNILVGLSDAPDGGFGGGGLLELSPTGSLLGSFQPLLDLRGTDWIDLAGDQCTVYYTSLGGSIKKFDVCNNQQLPDFCPACDDGNGGATAGFLFGLRLLPDGGVLVADWNGYVGAGRVRRYDSFGVQVREYTAANFYPSNCGENGDQPCFYPWAVVLDPDLSSFWTNDYISGEVFRFNLDTGNLMSSFPAGNCDDFYSTCAVTGLAMVGEPTAAAPPFEAIIVTATITAESKVYDGTTVAVTTCTLSGVVPGDDVQCEASDGAFDTKNVGYGKTVTATITLTGADASIYMVAPQATATADITPAPASVTPTIASKTYGDADPTLTGTTTGFVAADGITATYSRTTGETVAGSPYTISATLAPAGALGNYNITYNTAAFAITKANGSVTPNAASKTYGAADPTLNGSMSANLTAAGVSATYSRTAGETVAGSPYTISATLSPAGVIDNFNVTYNTASFTITPAAASVTPNAASKIYGTADPSFTGTLTGFLAADGVTAAYSRTAGETVAGGPYTISATLSPASVLGNYNVTYNTASFTIDKANASVTPNAASKTYGAADPSFTGTLAGFLSADGVTATYSRTAGDTVAGSPYTISATLSPAGVLGNYNVTYNTAGFTIDKANASVTPNAASKTYGAADPSFTGTLAGFLSADGVTATYSRTTGDAVAGNPYTISATLAPAAALGNYNVTYNTAGFTITPAVASVTPNAGTKTFGAMDPALTGGLSGFLPGDGVTATYTRTLGESVAGSPYIISAVLSPAAALNNYTISYNTAGFTITPAAASVTPNPATKTYGTAEPALTGTLSGFLSGVTATYTRTPGENVAGSPYAITAALSPASALSNYAITYNTAAFTITPATPVVTWANPADISYPTPLSGTQLNATANVSGTFAYTPPAGTVLNVGNGQPLSVLLTPTDNSNYTTATAQVQINVLPTDVGVVQTTPTPVVYVGDTAAYQLVVTGNGQGSSSNVVLTDVLPLGLDWTVSGPGASACSIATPAMGTPTLTCNFGSVAPGATRNITLSSVTTTTGCGDVQNTATVSSTGDLNDGNNTSATVTITVNCPAIAISKSTSTPAVMAGDPVSYRIVVTAGGSGDSTNVIMTDALPAGLTWSVSGADADSCAISAGVLTCSYGTMPPLDRRSVYLNAVTTAANCGTISNSATVTDALDIAPGDNSAGPVLITVNCPDVSVSVTAAAAIVNAGTNAVYNVVVTGNGPGTATSVTLTDTLPSGLTWTVGGPNAGSCTPSPMAGGTTLTCNFGSLAPGATRTITLTAATTTANCGVMKDTATVTAAGDINSSNNSSGPVSIAVSCPVPPLVTGVSLSCPNVSLVGGILMVSGDLDPATSALVTILYTSPSGATTTHTTTSAASGDYTDSLAANTVGKWKVRASAEGMQSPECSVIVYGKSQGGTFVIGDITPGATLHATADFWGSQWWKDNVWSGPMDPGVASLKGYLDAVDLPSNCGGSWSTRPGNSSKPPATIPEYMAVVISSSITKTGPTIAGDVVAEVIVKTSPGYGPAPGHDGFGEIVAVRCVKQP